MAFQINGDKPEQKEAPASKPSMAVPFMLGAASAIGAAFASAMSQSAPSVRVAESALSESIADSITETAKEITDVA